MRRQQTRSQIGVSHDHEQQVIKVVRNPAAENAKTLEPLCMSQLFFITLLNRDVDRDSDHLRWPPGFIHISTAPDQHPASIFRGMGIANLDLKRSLIVLAMSKRLLYRIPVVAVNQLQECFRTPSKRLRRKAKKSSQFGRPEQLAVLNI